MSDDLESFESHRPRLLRVAFRMLGSISEAEDVVQDAYLRWHGSERTEVRAIPAMLVRIVVHLAIDRKRRLATERASYPGPWLPDLWLAEPSQREVELSDEMSYATLVLLERLSPDERAAFLLREIFDYDYPTVAESLEKTEPACRKLVQRARERLAEPGDGAPKHAASREARRELLERLMAASRAESAGELERLLAPLGRLVSDGGGRVFAARYPILGAPKVARTLWRFFRKHRARVQEQLVNLSGEPAHVIYLDGRPYSISMVDGDESHIHALYMVLNPDKLRRLATQTPDA
jgi:RNA polymerase sigma-70 factor (ECF subfamily)